MWSGTSLRQSVASAILIALITACSSDKQASAFPVGIEITHRFAKEPLNPGRTLYKTAAGDEISVEQLRYYLSNFRLRRSDGTWFSNPKDPQTSQGYFLVDAARQESQAFLIGPVPKGEYIGIEFLLGVDPERNNAGAQRGDLDPARGMFWTWNTGYIFFKLEGHSEQSPGKQHEVAYHLGSSANVSNARRIYLPLKPEAIKVESGNVAQIHLGVDVAQVFEGAHRIRIADLHEAMSPKSGESIADNVAGIFNVEHVHNTAVAGNAASH